MHHYTEYINECQELPILHQWLYDPSQILIQELFSGLVQSAQVLDSGANQWSGSVRSDLAYRVIGCEIVCIINANTLDVSASYGTVFAWVFNLTHGLGVRWTIEPSADDGQQKKKV